MTIICPHCQNDDISLLEDVENPQSNTWVFLCRVCSKTFTVSVIITQGKDQ